MGAAHVREEPTEIEAHPLSHDPDRLFIEEKKKGRYKHVREGKNAIETKQKLNTIRFVCISDTHNRTMELENTLPSGDVLLHAGDFTQISSKEEIIHFNDFLGKVKENFKHIVVIAGNHEMTFDSNWYPDGSKYQKMFGEEPLSADDSKKLLTNCTYIEEESIDLFGIKIFGSPWQPEFADLGFNECRGEKILQKWNKIPNDTDILITHGPPLGIGDKCVGRNRAGCMELLMTIMDRVRPKYHLFGHIHEHYGIWDDGVTKYMNASHVTRSGAPMGRPIVFDYELPSTNSP